MQLKDKQIMFILLLIGVIFYINSSKLSNINKIQKESHERELKIITNANKKETVALTKLQTNYNFEVAKLHKEYKDQLDFLSQQQKNLYNKYISNTQLIKKDLDKLFNLKEQK